MIVASSAYTVFAKPTASGSRARACTQNEDVREVSIEAPVALSFASAKVARLDIAQALAIRELSKRHAEILIPT